MSALPQNQKTIKTTPTGKWTIFQVPPQLALREHKRKRSAFYTNITFEVNGITKKKVVKNYSNFMLYMIQMVAIRIGEKRIHPNYLVEPKYSIEANQSNGNIPPFFPIDLTVDASKFIKSGKDKQGNQWVVDVPTDAIHPGYCIRNSTALHKCDSYIEMCGKIGSSRDDVCKASVFDKPTLVYPLSILEEGNALHKLDQYHKNGKSDKEKYNTLTDNALKQAREEDSHGITYEFITMACGSNSKHFFVFGDVGWGFNVTNKRSQWLPITFDKNTKRETYALIEGWNRSKHTPGKFKIGTANSDVINYVY